MGGFICSKLEKDFDQLCTSVIREHDIKEFKKQEDKRGRRLGR